MKRAVLMKTLERPFILNKEIPERIEESSQKFVKLKAFDWLNATQSRFVHLKVSQLEVLSKLKIMKIFSSEPIISL